MTDKQIIDNEYWKNKYADIHIRLTNQIAELQEKLSSKEEVYIRNLNILANETEFLRKKLLMTEQECKKVKNIIKVALSDFWGEIGTKEYTKLTKKAKELGIEVKDYE